ncbi:teichoic acid D-Ala incorporation-associated protein DltX [Vagococcus penaei]|uniref:D-alanyl-lipoteichoic acid biosynthesis protein n=1 Tax=Vagococcus penaei TaxID=633807 RepID=A0A1Q2D3Y2_9ENTE|nr:teichoic acid D-Ala incorporation-associated protein DltX [Vagococcus penaei]AQP53078.1 D-alanyl-lipoteichoic acid biosynthesis protein [Vagococcus penaei]RSU06059.1 teichoic acid D-Ala incorporation-associated protein DltX [Vagococcus penaei]
MKKVEEKQVSKSRYWLTFAGKTFLYAGILVGLIYLYHYSHVGGGSFIYNQF